MRFRFAVVFLATFVGMARAQPPLNPVTPLVRNELSPTPGQNALTLAAADRAQELGFPAIAAGLYRNLLGGSGGDRSRVTLGLATALLDEGLPAQAEAALQAFPGPRGAAWHLRAALAAAQQQKIPAARAEVAAIKADEISATDRAWHLYIQGQLAETGNDLNRAREFYQQAEGAAPNNLARARFVLAREQARLRLGPVTEAEAEVQRKNLEQFQGRRIGYNIARTYAAMLDALGHKAEAVALLQRQLVSFPFEERDELDTTRLVMGLIAGAAEGPGRNALGELLRDGSDRDKQRIALQLLARASTRDPARADFRRRLDGLIGLSSAHPIREDLLLFRAVQSLADKNYAQAESDARTLLQEFPGSPLKAHAFGMLTSSAWEQARFRTAADNAVKARGELSPGPTHAQLGVLVAEAWFRAGDFRSAADAYVATLAEPPAGVPKGDLMFQRVLAEIDAGSLDTAQAVLDELAKDPAFDPVNLWQAEWNLARALQVQKQTPAAYARVNRLMTAKPLPRQLSPELRARMAWLQARLSHDVGQDEQTLKLIDALPAAMEGISPELKKEIQSTTALLKGEADFALGHDDTALETFNKLRADFPGSDAAVYSYFDEAKQYVKQDKTVKAQQLLTRLADEFPNNTYAPYALYQAALQAERRGQEANFAEANHLIEDLVKKYPRSDLVFYARLKQGDLLRKLNQFQQAQQVYESLVNNYAQHKDVILAQLALAECHHAQAAGDPAHAESAMVLFEHLRDRIDAPVDVRVEAGFNLGYLYMQRSLQAHERGDPVREQENVARAQEVWWKDVVNEFLLKDPRQAAQLGAKGPFWMAKTLLELGDLFERQEKLEQAKEAWLLIIKTQLPGADLARARLARFDLPEAKVAPPHTP
ncbi:MAG: Tetratricopeptide 4 [Verrucomicrobia bacterium]|nr:Tetratricopeptide 4 [Verrucomicrobiota bacterium]